MTVKCYRGLWLACMKLWPSCRGDESCIHLIRVIRHCLLYFFPFHWCSCKKWPHLLIWVIMIIIDMSYRVESCKIWFVWLFMMPGGLFWWSADLCFDHMFFVLIDDGKVYGGDWCGRGLSFNLSIVNLLSMCMGRYRINETPLLIIINNYS